MWLALERFCYYHRHIYIYIYLQIFAHSVW
jgi:hypothetical protein